MDILGSRKRKSKQVISEILSEQFPKTEFSYDFKDSLLVVTWVAGPSWFSVFGAISHLDCFNFLLSHQLGNEGFESVLEKLVSEGAHRDDFEIIHDSGVAIDIMITNPRSHIWKERMNFLQMALSVTHVSTENGINRTITDTDSASDIIAQFH